MLVDGAIEPTMITLDPHWGSNWRYKVLAEYWNNAPPLLPDLPNTAWKVERHTDGLYRSIAKRLPALARSVVVCDCVVHFMFIVGQQNIDDIDGRSLELLAHCLADSLNQRQTIISSLPLFDHRMITTTLQVRLDSPVSGENQNKNKEPMFSRWQILEEKSSNAVNISVQANLHHLREQLSKVKDASIEVALLSAWVQEVSVELKLAVDPDILNDLLCTVSSKPRFVMRSTKRTVDVPDYANPSIPSAAHYKLSRKDLSVVFKKLDVAEGKYELTAAKALIDPARDSFRDLIQGRILKYKRFDLVKFCIEQLDSLIAQYDHELKRVTISLDHEVSYDRSRFLAEAHDKLVKESRNYRYLLESCLSMPETGLTPVSKDSVLLLVASIDWLMVLYSASDVLHNDLDVAGLKLDHFFIPHVYYSDISGQKEEIFAAEVANMRLGVGLKEDDTVSAIKPTDPEWNDIDNAFNQDTGVSFNKFLTALQVLSCWPSANNVEELSFCYLAPFTKVRDVLVESITDLTPGEAERVISILTISPKGIRRLIGKSIDEGDVPIWEHYKRGDRYTLKPIVQNDVGILIWGAASMERASRVWQQNYANGYMPADFGWPNVKRVVGHIKRKLEEELETVTFTVLARATPYTAKGIDFMRRFHNENFDDVGDYDGLAYWPETNHWVTAECKYNRPPFCLKDARRLRDRIFGTPKNRAQFSKIEKRREFFQTELDRLISLLGWPPPNGAIKPTIHELYISRDIDWWMRNPPYPVPTHFVRIDYLDTWLREKGLVQK